MFTSLNNNIALIEENKEIILNLWLDYEIVKKTLQSNTLEHNFFKEKFGLKVFEFATGVIKSKNELGNCPVIGVMLILFKKKNIPLADVFIICVHLKNAFIHFLNSNNLLDSKTIDEICMLMDYNFNGVIKEYTLLYYNDEYRSKPCSIQSSQIELQTTEIKSKKKKTSAKIYISEIELDLEQISQ